MTDYRDALLSEILNCGYLDLCVLEDCKYDYSDLIENCKFSFGEINLNNLARTMFDMGIGEIEDSIQARIEELKRELSYYEEDYFDKEIEEMRDVLKTLTKLSPFEDIESCHNYLDTSIYFINNSEIYNSYCQEELKTFTDNTGFTITGELLTNKII